MCRENLPVNSRYCTVTGKELITMDKRFCYMTRQNLSFIKNKVKYCLTKLTCTISDNMILFESYGGTSYNDSVRTIYEELLQDERYRSFYFVWAFQDPSKYLHLLENHHTILVRKGTKEYRRYYATARYWINNVSVPDYLTPSKNQIYIETWHGTPLKCLGCDIKMESDPRQTKKHMHRRYRAKGRKVTYFPSPSPYYEEVMQSAFDLPEEKRDRFIETGYPRNDRLFRFSPEEIASLKEKWKIPAEKRVLLYTPTWRDSSQDAEGHFALPPGVDLEYVMHCLGDDYVLLFRAHHQVASTYNFHGCKQIVDVSDAEDINELYLISDLMITDYSSTLFDYSLLLRPIIFHMYDQDSYRSEIRGLYLPLKALPGPVTTTDDELVRAIQRAEDYFLYKNKQRDFNEDFYPLQDGNASKRVIEQCITQAPHPTTKRERFVRYARKTLNRMRIVHHLCYYNILGFFRSHGLFHNNNSLRLARLKNTHKGERCFLIGNGPSLTGEDLNLLKDEYTFGTNMVYKIFDQTDWRPSFHCVSDTIYASKLGTELSEMVKAPLFTTERTYRRMRKKPIDTTYVHTIQTELYKVRGNIQAYCMIKATVLSLAAEMAFHMGFSEIYLLGVDCTNPHDKGGHFTDNYATKEVAETDINRIKTRMNAKSLTTKQIGDHIIDRSMEVYHLLNRYATKHGIRIYNATRGGNLEIFPRVSLEEVLAQKEGAEQ